MFSKPLWSRVCICFNKIFRSNLRARTRQNLKVVYIFYREVVCIDDESIYIPRQVCVFSSFSLSSFRFVRSCNLSAVHWTVSNTHLGDTVYGSSRIATISSWSINIGESFSWWWGARSRYLGRPESGAWCTHRLTNTRCKFSSILTPSVAYKWHNSYQKFTKTLKNIKSSGTRFEDTKYKHAQHNFIHSWQTF